MVGCIYNPYYFFRPSSNPLLGKSSLLTSSSRICCSLFKRTHCQVSFVMTHSWERFGAPLSVFSFSYSWLTRCCTARGYSKGFFHFSPTKVKAGKSFLFTESSLVLKIKSTWFIFIVTLYSY